jgi:hypothetical protein
LNDVVDHLVVHGFLLFVGGSNDRQYGGRFSRTSRIKPTVVLRRLFADCQATEFDFSKHTETETIILNEFDIDSEGNVISTGGLRKKKKVVQLEYKDTSETRLMRDTLNAYNHLLRNTYVDISSLEKSYVDRQRSDGKTIRVPVNQRSKFVRRIFSRGEWYYNGKFYGGFWQQVGEEYRKDIRIGDIPTIEVDFKGLHPAIIAATKGVNSVGDRYSLEEGLIPRLNSDQQRDAVKLLALQHANDRCLVPRYLKDGTCRATHASNALGKWLKKDFGMTAHSLRHTFRDRLRASGCPLELIDQIGGWSSIGTIGSKYGQGYELDAVRDQLSAISSDFNTAC